MDYEKAYKAVLKTATQWIEDGCSDKEKICLEAIFPELRESEDERIRKELKEAFEVYDIDSTWNGIPIRSILAWLEKQKDINCLACDQHLKGYLAGRKVTEEEKQKENLKSADSIPSDCVSDAKCEDRSPKHSDSDGTDIRDTPAYWRGWDDAMKQKEQKSVWSEEDENALKYLHELISFGFTEKIFDAQTAADMREWLNTRLKSLRPSWKPTEGQMTAILRAEGVLRLHEQEEVAKRLAELYEQLKKL